MHELSIAENIIEIIKENVPEKELCDIKNILLEVGDMSGIVSESLQFCFDVIKSETPFKNAEMKIKKIPFVLFCNDCKKESTNSIGIKLCQNCGSTNTKVISGDEMKVIEVELV
jgi:hydrogenase nickel incorporation protein HypA/HybF